MPQTKRLTRAVILALSASMLAACSDDDDSAPATGTDAFSLQILHFADIDGSGGAADARNMSALIDGFRSEMPGRTLVLSSGDNLIPGPEYFAASDERLTEALGEPGNGRANIAWLNAMGVQASVVGNHDLDAGTEAFAELISPDGEWPGAGFPYLSANIDFTTDSHTAALVAREGVPAEAGKLSATATLNVDGGVIGVVGASVPTLPSITSTGGLTLSPSTFDPAVAADLDALAAEIQDDVNALMDAGINKIILLAHMQQLSVEKALAPRLDGVDVIVAGGSNTLLADSNDSLRDGDHAAGDYPLSFESASGEPVLVVNTDGDFSYLGRLVLSFDERGRIVTEALDPGVNGAWSTAMINPAFEVNAAVAALTDALDAVLVAKDGNVLGKTSVYLDGRRSQVRTQETNLGNLTAEANLWLAQQQDASVSVSLKNGGGIRDGIGLALQPPGTTDPSEIEFLPPAANALVGKPAGGISQLDLETSLRFNNRLAMVTVTPAELADLMEYAFAASGEGSTPGRFPQIAGMRVAFDDRQTARANGDSNLASAVTRRVRELEILDANGAVVQDVVTGGVVDITGAPIRMVTLAFLAGDCVNDSSASCGDGYPFKNLVAPNRADVTVDPGQSDFSPAGGEQDAMAEYLKVVYPVSGEGFAEPETAVDQDARIVNVAVRATP
ncbi:5'-nucleotidase C-terminal domain-containing protein [Marinobacter daepoensis]|uniref:5'-nucleotidase C-terminal domain-containing protein n=1 Tax=Marinobacter daepoensis TaxID=262077 RepID=A0ABS3BA62_9GAMM|nr:5'-nucleotidase C-terminal domain-containing protein [Marinobacter daepoensis]MBN7768698.1 5'-nucleotidase C-terminal domain-containing protein [Marinobacter daepoensis]MBY6032843.1 5'-nucleotidase C-terminal domain-containing protein [Marinobacter daepoensis]MBY6079435.1 5'-nucleotidase C-terminal domain-containing protein [Marinobacter daepoensis]